jgi:hypothetical protein
MYSVFTNDAEYERYCDAPSLKRNNVEAACGMNGERLSTEKGNANTSD